MRYSFFVLWAIITCSCGAGNLDAGLEPASPGDLKSPGRLQSIESEQPPASEPVEDDTVASPPEGCPPVLVLPQAVAAEADAQTLQSLGQEQIRAGDGMKAAAILTAAHKNAPKDATILGDLAISMFQCNCHDLAIKHAKNSVELAPDNVDLVANLAQIYQITGQIDEAIKVYKQALEISKDDDAIHNNLAVMFAAKGDLDAAESEVRTALRINEVNPSYLINLGYILFRQKRLVDSEMVLRRAINIDAQNADAYNQLGLVLNAQERKTAARKAFEQALEIDPNHKAALENINAVAPGFGLWRKELPQ